MMCEFIKNWRERTIINRARFLSQTNPVVNPSARKHKSKSTTGIIYPTGTLSTTALSGTMRHYEVIVRAEFPIGCSSLFTVFDFFSAGFCGAAFGRLRGDFKHQRMTDMRVLALFECDFDLTAMHELTK